MHIDANLLIGIGHVEMKRALDKQRVSSRVIHFCSAAAVFSNRPTRTGVVCQDEIKIIGRDGIRVERLRKHTSG